MLQTPVSIELKRAEISAKIEKIESEVAESGLTISEIEQAGDAQRNIMNLVMSGEIKGEEARSSLDDVYNRAAILAGDVQCARGFKDTLTMPLMHITKRFLICTGGLISPAGISPSDLIFSQTSVAIQSDKKPTSYPQCNEALYLIDMATIEGSTFFDQHHQQAGLKVSN